jgi:hypothetical protein
MPKITWTTLAADSQSHHLVVAQVPAGVTDDPEALVGRLLAELAPIGDFALTSQKEVGATTVFCAFALATDADGMIEAVNAHEDNLHLGWASEHHCTIDKAAAECIVSAIRVEVGQPKDPTALPSA